MVSVNPLQDLHLTLLPTTTTTAAAAATLITPKLEPKPEPYDDYQFQQPFLSAPTNNPTSQIQDEYNRISNAFRTAFAGKTHFPQPSDDDATSDPDSRALVLVPETQNQTVAVASPTTPIPNPNKRSSELVRVTDFGANEQRYFREVIRKTRMIYESLRVYAEEEERQSRFCSGGGSGRVRSDLKAASVMKAKGLWQNRDKRIVGNVPGVQIGDLFVYRMELCVVGLHGTPQAGIDFLPGNCSSNKEPIATSIVVSG